MPIPLILLVAAVTAPLTPKGPWNVHAADSDCMLSRNYDAGGQAVSVAFQPGLDGKSLAFSVLTPDRDPRPAAGEAKVIRSPDGHEFTGRYFSTPTTDKLQRYTQIWLSGDVFSQLGETNALRIKAKSIDMTVPLDRSAKARAAFRQCEDGLLESFGVRPAAFRGGTPPETVGSILKFFGPDIYPPDAMSNGYSGPVRAVLIVGADGQVKDCRIPVKIGQAFDKVTCEIAGRIRFKPGRDENGVPTRPYSTST